ncbi:MAG: hypothetical protein DRJ03_29730 [Chloroflexi bacterium]|nr:MAG: hypothetical protein DRI81_18415 [Chloroflexota bacterium]RLC75769.1 MAG: hypothetical protein DRJ03_29730 [Chloroflexota bacterium]HEY72807.1 hypothetical protein [Thermoflexia bacterium]
MLKAHWHGYEIDSSEAAYETRVPQPEQLGTLVRGLLSTSYFVRSYYLPFEEPLLRLRDFIADRGEAEDKLTAKTLEYLEQQILKFDPDSWQGSRIGVRAIESILNYVGAHRQELLEAQTFRFDLTEEQKEMREDYGSDEEFEPGSLVDEEYYYSEDEIPLDGVVLYLGCSLVPASKLDPREAKRAYKLVHENYKAVGLLDEMADWSWGPPRDYVQEDINRRHGLSLRVRLNPDATFTITGRWMDDGQFILPYYDYLLGLAAKKAGIKLGIYCL